MDHCPPRSTGVAGALAIGAAVIALALIIWAASALFGGGSDTPEADSAAASSSLTTDVSFTPNPSGSNAPEGGGGSGGGAAGGSGGSGTQASGSSSSSSSSSTTGAPVPAGQCADSSLAVKATADKATFAPGEEPSFTIVITNIGSAPCDRDLAGGLQQVLVYSIDGKTRLWSNVDCYPQPASRRTQSRARRASRVQGRLVGHDVDPPSARPRRTPSAIRWAQALTRLSGSSVHCEAPRSRSTSHERGQAEQAR